MNTKKKKGEVPVVVVLPAPGERLAVALENEALAQLEELQRERTYQGKNEAYYRRAKICLGVVGSAVRLLATLENRRTNDIGVTRLPAPAELGTGKPEGADT